MVARYPYALSPSRYRSLLADDYARLRELAEQAFTELIPACPGWLGEDLIRHTALIYLRKAETIRTGSKPHGKWIPEELSQASAVTLLEEGYGRLIEQFDAHSIDDPAESWLQEDQTLRFWIRRLTHETSIHRCDIEAALGAVTPIDEDLAVDGIDEILTVMLRRGTVDESASGATVTIESGGKTWSATLNATGVAVSREKNASSTAGVSGTPNDVLLWMWGRGLLPHDSKDSAPAAELRMRLAAAT